MSFVVCTLSAIVFVELVGYWLHRLLHSEKLPVLSRAHMLHHLRDYGPETPLHRKEYFSSADDRASLLGVGMEWIIPIVTILSISLTTMAFLGVGWKLQVWFTIVGVFWGYILFGYMHSSLHLTHFWMDRLPILKTWYRTIRRLHDFHHMQISSDGRMLMNYGICFFWFDRVFRTYSPKSKPYNSNGFDAALVRYQKILN